MPSSVFDENLESKITLESESTPLPESEPFHILILGNWGGDSDFSSKSFSARKPIEIDRDEFDDVIRKIRPQINLKFDGDNVLNLTFESLDDFHPDNIFQRLSLFADLKDIRRKLKKADTFNEAADEVRSWYSNQTQENQPSSDIISSSSANSFDSSGLLDRILDSNEDNISVIKPTSKSALGEFVSNIAAPHIVNIDFDEQANLLAVVDEVISDLMRKILHHEDFQKLESAWRGLYFLVRRVETDNKLKIFLAQLTKAELLDNLSSVNDLSDSWFDEIVAGKSLSTGIDSSWAAICGNYKFSPIVEDIAALMRIAKIAAIYKSPFISQITPHLFGFNSFSQNSDVSKWKVSEETSEYKLWSALRSLPESSYMALVLSGLIGRIPYGEQTDSTESFTFEEFESEPYHDQYLWLNPCFAYAYLLADEYSSNDWQINVNRIVDIKDLPLHVYEFEGETLTKPCAEINLTEAAFNLITDQGVTPLISFRGEDRVRLSRLRSLSLEASILKGKW